MPWCPKCGVEYREGFELCSDCGCKLSEVQVPSATEADMEAEQESEPGSEPKYDTEAFLISTANSIEADMIEGLLNANEIPVLRKYGEAGDYLMIFMGSVKYAVDLYVPSHLLDKAKEIIETNQGAFGEAVIPDEELEAQALEAEPLEEEPEEEDEESEKEDAEPEVEDVEPEEDDKEPEEDDGEPEENVKEPKKKTEEAEGQDDGSMNGDSDEIPQEDGSSESESQNASLFHKFTNWLSGK